MQTSYKAESSASQIKLNLVQKLSTQCFENAVCLLSDKEYISMHNQIVRSGRYNFEGCKFSLKTHLNIAYFRFMLHGYKDVGLCDLLEFGFPLGYFGTVQRQEPNAYTQVKNHCGAKMFPAQVQKFLCKEKSYNAILGPFSVHLLPFDDLI